MDEVNAKPSVRKRYHGALLAAIHRHHPFWGRVIWTLDTIWHIIWYLWGLLIIGGLAINPVINFFIQGNFGPDIRTWYVTRGIEAHPIVAASAAGVLFALTILSRLAHARAHATVRRVLARVRDLDPNLYVPRYVGGVYLSRIDKDGRDLDTAARDALAQAVKRPDQVDPRAPLGICVFGRPTLGKTRLAWEAMRAALPDYHFIKWLHGGADDLDWEAIDGECIALWLDDLQEYANTNEGPAISDLPRRFAEAGARLVVIATCRAGSDADQANRFFTDLLDRLEPLTPADITASAADQLADNLARQGETVERDEFDGTPGSLLLGVKRMRDQIYPALPQDAQRLLRTMKLLRGAHIYTYPSQRLRTVGERLFGLTPGMPAYRDAAEALVRASFAQRGKMDAHGLPALYAVADVYLEHAIPDFPPVNSPKPHTGLNSRILWPRNAMRPRWSHLAMPSTGSKSG